GRGSARAEDPTDTSPAQRSSAHLRSDRSSATSPPARSASRPRSREQALKRSGRKRSETIWKCTVLPPTDWPLLLSPSCTGSSPPVMRSPSQKSFFCSYSSEAKSSSGRQKGPASKATTENPALASLQARVPPPAPVPTIAKSTSSSSRQQRIG